MEASADRNLRGLRHGGLIALLAAVALALVPSPASAQLPPLGPSFSINDVTVMEGNSGTVNADFTVTISAAPAAATPASVNFATQNVTATQPSDYTQKSGTLTFNNGEPLTKTVTVVVNGDVIDESNETFNVVLSNPGNATISKGTGVGTITDDDIGPDPTASITDVAVTEGNTGTTNAVFTVTLSRPPDVRAQVTYTTQDATATHPQDYTETAGTLVFSPTQMSKQVTVAVKGDTAIEPHETFTVNLVNPQGATIADPTGVGTITDDDGPDPAITVADTDLAEGDEGVSNAAFIVTLSRAPNVGEAVSVDFATLNGTATQPSDYLRTEGEVTFAPGEVSKQILVPVNGDIVDEANETFTVNLAGPTGATIADGTATGTITNDDGAVPGLTFPKVKTSGGSKPALGKGAKTLLITAKCPRTASSPCAGSFNVAAELPGRRDRTKTFRLGAADFSIPSGERAEITVPVAAKLRKKLRNLDERFEVTIVTTLPGDAAPETVTATVRPLSD